MNVSEINGRVLRVVVLAFMLAAFAGSASGQTVAGANCYADLFEEKVIGHNLTNTYLLMYAAYNTYENRMNVASFAEFQKRFVEIFKPLGMSKFDFINKKDKTADTQAVVMSNDKLVIVSFRGSEASQNQKFSPVKMVYDWLLTDFNFFKKRVLWWGWGVKVHTGFYNAIDIVYDDLKSLIQKHMAGPGKRLWITGHSLGAGIAPIAAFRLTGDGISVQGLYTFAGPRIGNDIFVKAFKKRFPDMQRWVLNNDIVSKIPFKVMKYKHLSAPNNIYADGRVVLGDEEMRGPGKVKSHLPGMYLQKIYDLLPLELKDRMPPPPAFGNEAAGDDAELERSFNGNAEKAEEDLNN
ncbi:MAG TPA: lipase family protein [Candidatus Rifleibacterium sp.]|nr:lipase family protein [Candidatus Rifleibacterium sp.]HPT47268.1 lipase family protein [Candidatus Rifleibacterium sp.]